MADWISGFDAVHELHYPVFEKYVVPGKEYERALTILNRQNINYATLYPDLEGAARHASFAALMMSYEGLNPPDGPVI
jgi:hypothetical protein